MKSKHKIVELQTHEYISGKEYEEYMEDFKKVTNEVVGKVISIADKHNIDRDDAMQHFSVMFRAVVDIGRFQNWGSE